MPKRMKISAPLKQRNLSPLRESLRVVLPYVILGCLWILLTDPLLNLAPDKQGTVFISIIKGSAYVLITAALLWALVFSRVKQVRASQKQLEDSEARFRLLVESAPDAVFVQADYRFAYVNAKAVKLFGAESESELLGQPVDRFVPEKLQTLVMEQVQRANVEKAAISANEETIRRIDGGRTEVEVSAVSVRFGGQDGALVFMRDITGRKQFERNRLRMELQLREKHRLESIGTLASGIAHEINNPITGIINYAQLISDSPLADEKLHEYSEEIMREGQRVADTVKNLLSFSQYNKQAHVQVSAGDLVRQTIALVEAVLRHDQIDLSVCIADDLPLISCSAQQIRQVLMNLITNARDALNARYRGYDVNKRMSVSAEPINRGGYRWVRFTVEDRGAGISADLLPKIFDPFFTTSMRSEHAGLGLSICLGIVKEHHGDIRFESEAGKFTRAIMELPAEEGALI